MSEVDLYPPVKSYLERQGYTVKGEVRDCDVVAVRGDEPPVIVELKASFTLSLLLQGVDRQAMTDAVYVAFPPPKRRQLPDALKLCRRLGLGVLLVSGRNVEAVLDPAPYQPRKSAPRRTMLLKEFHHRIGDPVAGGSASAPRMTAYRQDALRCAAFLGEAGPAAPKVVRSATEVERAAGILRNDVYGWFHRPSRGVYALTPKGTAALATFSRTVEAIKTRVSAAG